MSDAVAHNDSTEFEAMIRPLFRKQDVDAMAFAFRLDDYQSVKDRAAEILERLEEGTMPCDGPWPADRIAVFRRWASIV